MSDTPSRTAGKLDHSWVAQLPGCLTSIDVETTGLSPADRIVSIAIVQMKPDSVSTKSLDLNALYLIFDPGKRSHADAERVHGWSDWTLRHQDFFTSHAAGVFEMLSGTDLLVRTTWNLTLVLSRANYRLRGSFTDRAHRFVL